MNLTFHSYDITFREVPNEVSLTFSMVGCSNLCKGCHSPHLRGTDGTEFNYVCIDDIFTRYSKTITTICLLGGDNADNIIDVLHYIKTKYPSLKIALYTGKVKVREDIIEYLDFVKEGPYIEELGGLDSILTNQRFYTIDNSNKLDITHMFRR